MAEMSRREVSWSELLPEILSIIAVRLNLRSDVIKFRSVCHSWRISAPFSLFPDDIPFLSPILPLNFKIVSDRPIAWDIPQRPLNLVAVSVILVQSIDNPSLPPWLIFAHEFHPGKLQIQGSLCRFPEKLPEDFARRLSSSRLRVSEITRVYNIYEPISYLKRNWSNFRKVVVYDESNAMCESESSGVDDCALIALYNHGSLARISLKDGMFSKLTCKSVKKFDDVVCFRGRICVIDREGRLYREENGKLVAEGEGLVGDSKKLLVVEPSCGELYLVYISVAFRVYKLNEEKKKWEEVEGIGDDKIIVATADGCFFVPAKDIPTWGGNCLVFRRGVFSHIADSEFFKTPLGTTSDVAVFHFGSGECKPLRGESAKVLWPPPAWLGFHTKYTWQCFA